AMLHDMKEASTSTCGERKENESSTSACGGVERRIRRKVAFFYGARARRDLFYVDELHALSSQLTDFGFIPALSEPLPDDAWDGETGLITDVVDRHVTPEQAQGTREGGRLEAYLCGPPPMIDAAMVMLQ